MARISDKLPAAVAAATVARDALKERAMRFSRHGDGHADAEPDDLIEVTMQHHIDRTLSSNAAVGLALIDVDVVASSGNSIDGMAWATRLIQERRPRPLMMGTVGPHLLLMRAGVNEADAASSLMFDIEALRDDAVQQSALRVNHAGIAGAPRDGTRSGQLVHAAAAAMFSSNGRSSGGFHSTSSGAKEGAAPTRKGLAALGIPISDLQVAFQPKVSFSDLTLLGAEALVRWPTREPDAISASAIVARCRAHGQMGELTDHVLDKVGLLGARLQQDGEDPISLSVNMSAEDLADPQLSVRIDKALQPHGVSPETIVVEITEDSLLPAEIERINTLPKLRDLGVELSIDDFGTGYSSLSHLRRFAVQELKIDMFFVDRMAFQPKDAIIVRAIVEMGRGLGMRVVAEGVESTEAWRMLEEYEVDVAQGHNVARAMLPEDFLAWRQSWLRVRQDRVRSTLSLPEISPTP